MLPISQSTAGWILILAGVVAFIGGFTLRWLVRLWQHRAGEPFIVRWVRRSPIGTVLMGKAGADDVDSDEDLDNVTVVPAAVAAAVLFIGGLGLVSAASFGIEFTLFRKG